MSKETTYIQILKNSTVLGGTQIVVILIQIIRSKIIAVLLGTVGFGYLGLMMSIVNVISSITNCGLNVSAVKNISESTQFDNDDKFTHIISIFSKLILFTALLGMISTIIFSPFISKIVFGNSEFIFQIIALSLSLFFLQLGLGQNTYLQGLRKIQFLAKANLIGNLIGLIFSIPLYFIFKIDAIVPAIIINSIIIYLVNRYFLEKLNLKYIKVSFNRAWTEGKPMIMMGVMLNLGLVISQLSAFGIRAFISRVSEVAQVGLFSAAFTIINSYVNVIFTTLSSEYYPRLCAVSSSKEKYTHTVNQQSEIILIALLPILTIFICYIDFGIKLLYSEKFLEIALMLRWCSIAILFKGISFAIAHLILAKQDSKLYFYNELFSNVYMLIFNIIGYYFYGLTGVGISFLVGYFFYFLQVSLVTKFKYEFIIDIKIILFFILCLSLMSLCFYLNFVHSQNQIFKIIMVFLSLMISIYFLNKKTNFFSLLKNKLS